MEEQRELYERVMHTQEEACVALQGLCSQIHIRQTLWPGILLTDTTTTAVAHTHSLYKEIVKSVELQQQVDYLVLWLVSIRACYLGKVLSFAVI